MEKTDRKRRNVLKTLILSLGGLALIGRFLTPRLQSGQTRLDVAKETIPAEGALVYRRSRVALMREGDETYALDLTCTHLGCTVTVKPSELVCPCHGSRFDRRGSVLKGPADRPLRRLALQEQGDRWVVKG